MDFPLKVTVGDLASMASGSSWKESYYSPFTITARAYFGKELEKTILGLTTVDPVQENLLNMQVETPSYSPW